MTTGRKVRLGGIAIMVAMLFAIVAIGHSGAHLPTVGADPGSCALCDAPGVPAVPPVTLFVAGPAIDVSPAVPATVLEAVSRLSRARGPPRV